MDARLVDAMFRLLAPEGSRTIVAPSATLATGVGPVTAAPAAAFLGYGGLLWTLAVLTGRLARPSGLRPAPAVGPYLARNAPFIPAAACPFTVQT